jgi:integrase
MWQFRWSEKDLHGTRVQQKRVIDTVERYPDEAAARTTMAVFLAELNSEKVRMGSRSITVAQLCDHFEQRELANDNTWRSYSTKKTYKAYLVRWVLPNGRQYELAEVRTIGSSMVSLKPVQVLCKEWRGRRNLDLATSAVTAPRIRVGKF